MTLPRIPDLALVIVASLLAAAAAALQLPAPVRLVLGVPAVLLLPGYATSTVLFTSREMTMVERLAVSLSLSLAICILVAAVLSATPAGLNTATIVLSLTAVTVGAAVGGWRRRGAAVNGRGKEMAHARQRTPRARRQLGILVAVTGVAATVVLVGAVASQSRPLTEFYIVGPVPEEAQAGKPVTITVAITSHEPPPATYRIVAMAGPEVVGTTGPVEVAPDGSWNGELTVTMPVAGDDQPLDIVLDVVGGAPGYRALRASLDVTAPD